MKNNLILRYSAGVIYLHRWLILSLAILGCFPERLRADPDWPSTYLNNCYAELYTVPFGATSILGPQPVTVWATDGNIRITTGTSLLDKILEASGLQLPSGFPGSPNTTILDSNKLATYLVGDVDANNSPQPNSMYSQQSQSSKFGGMLAAIFNSDWEQWIYSGSTLEGHFWSGYHWQNIYLFASLSPLEAGTLFCKAPLLEPWKITPDIYVSATNQMWVSFEKISHGTQSSAYFQPPPGANPLLIDGESSDKNQPFGGNLPPGLQSQPVPPSPPPPYPWSPP